MLRKKFNLTEYLLSRPRINPEKKVVYWKGRSLTHKELGTNILKTGMYLKNLGIKSEERVLLLLNDTPAFFDFFLGCISIGAIPVPLNPKLKNSDLSYILNDSRATAIVIEKKSLEEIEEIFNSSKYLAYRDKIIIQDRYFRDNEECFYSKNSKIESIKIEKNFNFLLKKGDTPCFWQYTSGTTGNPKAVIHSQISIIKNIKNFAVGVLGINEDDIIYSTSKMFFGYGLGNSLFTPLYTGAAVILDDRWASLLNIKENIEVYSPTIWFSVPKLYSTILRENFQIKHLERIRVFYSSGSNLNAKSNMNWQKYSGIAVTQGIGCTEIGHIFLSNIPGKENLKATGIPLSSFNIKIVNDEGKNVEVGQIGELWVQPPFNLLGYWEKPELTNEKFSKDNWYRTGDYFCQDQTGNYIYQSRIDDFFKVNGRMVAPSIIENEVKEYFDVSEAVFIAIDNEQTSDVDTVLCLVPINMADKLSLKVAIAEYFSNNRLSYMSPNMIMFFHDFQYNVNGKIIRKEVIKIVKQLLFLND